MPLVKFFLLETNKQISLGVAASVFLHVAVLSFFLINDNRDNFKKIEADLLAVQSIPIQVVNSVQPTQKVAQEKKTVVSNPKEIIKKTGVSPQKNKVKTEELQKTVAPDATISKTPSDGPQNNIDSATSNNAQSNPVPIVVGGGLVGRRVQPDYPKRSLDLKQEGTVILHVLISDTGKRQDIKLFKPSKYALLNQAAMKAVKKWTFDPNIVNGRAVKSWVEIPIEFKIQ